MQFGIKHSEAAKLRRQRNMAQMKEQNKTPEKELNRMAITSLLDRVQNTGDQDAQRTHLMWKQCKKDPGRNEGYTK